MDHRMMVSPEKFKRQMTYINEKHYVVNEEALVKHLHSMDRFQRSVVLLTFDDGYRDNLENALPILREFNMPAIIFVSGEDDVSDELRWWHDLALIVESDLESDEDTSSESDFLHYYWKKYFYLSALPQDQRLKELKTHIDAFDRDRTSRRLEFLSIEDIREMQKDRVSFGGHTLHHVNIGQLESDTARREIVGCVDLLGKHTGKQVMGFAYPFGKRSNYKEESKSFLREAGVKYAVTTEWGLNRYVSDPLALERIFIDGNDSIYAFMCKVEGIFKT
jgi:peptidoglycan/xylan/chitin deacetylase (PgdA/CDA1 family)